VATLDLISDGRVEFGTGEASSGAELGGFLVERSRKREMWEDAIDAITRMFVEEPFAGWSSEFVQMPPRNVVPKPRQRPHPPLWVACSRRETIQFAARNGIGALSFSFVEPEDAGRWVREYYELLSSEECVPAGFAVNPNVAVVLPMMLHADEQTAIDRGIDGAHFFGYSLAHYYGMGRHEPARTNVWEEFLANRDTRGFAREIVTADAAPLAVKLMQHGLGSLRGAIGTPDQVRDLVRRYESVGVDEVIFVLQAGPNRHDHIVESLELFGAEVLPEFAAEREQREAEKAARLQPAIERALARRTPPREAPAGYVVDEEADLERAARRRRRRAVPGRPFSGPRDRAGAREDAQTTGPFSRSRLAAGATGVFSGFRDLAGGALERGAQAALVRAVRGADDAQLERRFGNQLAQRVIFAGMASQFEPKFAFGFEGDIAYELTHVGNGSPPSHWTVRVADGAANAVPGPSPSPAVSFRLSVPDFARLVTEQVEPQELLFGNRFHVEGDLHVALRVREMFGGPPQF